MARHSAIAALCVCACLGVTGCGQLALWAPEPVADAATAVADANAPDRGEPNARPSGEGDQLAKTQPAEAPAEQRRNHDEPKSRIVRALLAALNELNEDDEDTTFDDESDEFDTASERREYVEKILRDSDEELSRVLEQNPKEAILRANRRQPHFVVMPGRVLAVEPADGDAANQDAANDEAVNPAETPQ